MEDGLYSKGKKQLLFEQEHPELVKKAEEIAEVPDITLQLETLRVLESQLKDATAKVESLKALTAELAQLMLQLNGSVDEVSELEREVLELLKRKLEKVT